MRVRKRTWMACHQTEMGTVGEPSCVGSVSCRPCLQSMYTHSASAGGAEGDCGNECSAAQDLQHHAFVPCTFPKALVAAHLSTTPRRTASSTAAAAMPSMAKM